MVKDILKYQAKVNRNRLLEYIEANNTKVKTLYLDLGVKVVRLVCYSELFIPHIKKQLSYSLRETANNYDSTIFLWQQNDFDEIFEQKEILNKGNDSDLLNYFLNDNTVSFFSSDFKMYFYCVKNFEPEEFIKEGHIFVRFISEILKTTKTNLVHGACIGLNNHGILICARGQRGKSTLAVLSLLEGFEYVSDDYLTIEKDGDKLYAYPIYSIITLSPRMYNEMYEELDGTKFVSNNARKDKYVINIEKYHNQFRDKYPIDMCMVLEFTSENSPSIVQASSKEKKGAITQIVHSTIFQMLDMFDRDTVKKLIDMVNDYKFFKICLCNNIYKNVDCLRKFLEEYKHD